MQRRTVVSAVVLSLSGLLILGALVAGRGARVDAQTPAPAVTVTVTADSGPTGTMATIRVTGPPAR